MRSLKCGCRWDGWSLRRCGRHWEAGSLAVDLDDRNPTRTALLVRATDLRAKAEAPAWMFENAFRHALGLQYHTAHITVDALLDAWGLLPVSMRSRICDDVYTAIREGRAGTTYAVNQWERLLAREAADGLTPKGKE